MVNRRSRADGGRPFTAMVALSDREKETITAAAEQANMALGAWIGDVAVRMAEHEITPTVEQERPLEGDTGGVLRKVMMTNAMVSAYRQDLAGIANNLNQLTHWTHANRQLHAEVPDLVVEVRRAVAEAGEIMSALYAVEGDLSERLQAERRRRARRR